MNTLDILILVITGLGILSGAISGAVRQIATAVGLVAAFLLGTLFMYPVGETVTGLLATNDRYAGIAGFIVVFVAVWIVVLVIAHLLESILSKLRLTPINRMAGGVIGGSKAVFLLSITFFALAYIDVPEENSRNESLLYLPVVSVLPHVWQYVTERAPDAVSMVNRVDDQIESEKPQN